jgi:hypothetical protein
MHVGEKERERARPLKLKNVEYGGPRISEKKWSGRRRMRRKKGEEEKEGEGEET